MSFCASVIIDMLGEEVLVTEGRLIIKGSAIAEQNGRLHTILAIYRKQNCYAMLRRFFELGRNFLLTPPQQCDFGWFQHPGSGRDTELPIE
jgi:hypothetical protein